MFFYCFLCIIPERFENAICILYFLHIFNGVTTMSAATDIPLTRKQRVVFEYLENNQEIFRDNPPSLDQLCDHLGLKSRGSLHKHIHALINEGLIEPINGLHRGIRLTKAENDPVNSDAGGELPLVGKIAAGIPLEAIEDAELIGVPEQLQTNNQCFVLEVQGDSMIDAGILEGDHVVIEKRSNAQDGDIVVALIDGSDATLKTIEQRQDQVTLHPANSTMMPFTYHPEQVQIQGVLVGQMRSYL